MAAGALGAAAPVPAAGKTAAMALVPLPLATILMRAAPVAAAAVAGIPVVAIPAVAATTGAPKARQGRRLAKLRLIAPLLQGKGRRFQHAWVRISAAGGPGEALAPAPGPFHPLHQVDQVAGDRPEPFAPLAPSIGMGN